MVKKIAQSHGAKWHVNTDWQGFGRQRQLCPSLCHRRLDFGIDADEVVTPQLKKNSILKVIKTPPLPIRFMASNGLILSLGIKLIMPYGGLRPIGDCIPKKFQYDNNLVHESVILNDATTKKIKWFFTPPHRPHATVLAK